MSPPPPLPPPPIYRVPGEEDSERILYTTCIIIGTLVLAIIGCRKPCKRALRRYGESPGPVVINVEEIHRDSSSKEGDGVDEDDEPDIVIYRAKGGRFRVESPAPSRAPSQPPSAQPSPRQDAKPSPRSDVAGSSSRLDSKASPRRSPRSKEVTAPDLSPRTDVIQGSPRRREFRSPRGAYGLTSIDGGFELNTSVALASATMEDVQEDAHDVRLRF